MGTKFGTNVTNRMLLNAAKLQGYRFWVIKGKPTGGVKLRPPPSPRLGLKAILKYQNHLSICSIERKLKYNSVFTFSHINLEDILKDIDNLDICHISRHRYSDENYQRKFRYLCLF